MLLFLIILFIGFMSDKIPIVININNKDVTLNIESRLLLVDLLRNNLELKDSYWM